MFWLARLIKFARPIPPTPTPAMFSKSLGGVIPFPNTCRGTMVSPAPATATSFTNSRRVISRLLLIVFPRAPSCAAKLHRSSLLTQPNAVTNNLSIFFQSERQTSMFIHMFAFQLKPAVTEAQQDRMIREIGALKDHIPSVLESYVVKNLSPRGQGYVI